MALEFDIVDLRQIPVEEYFKMIANREGLWSKFYIFVRGKGINNTQEFLDYGEKLVDEFKDILLSPLEEGREKLLRSFYHQ